MMPLPVVLACAILIGWPLLKLVATLICRPQWRRARMLAADLKSDQSYGEAEHASIDRAIAEARGEPLQILMPLFVVAGGVAFAFAHPFNFISKDETLDAANARQELIAKQELEELELRLRKLRIDLSLPPRPPRNSRLWNDSRYERLTALSFELSLLRYPVASLLTGLAALAVAPLIFMAEGLRASAWPVVRRLILSSAYSSRIFARSVGVIS